MKDQSKMSSNNVQAAAELAASTAATKITYTGSIASISGWVFDSDVIAMGGLVLAVVGFVVNLIFKIREDQRQVEAHEIAKKRATESDPNVQHLLNEIPKIMRSNRMQGPYDAQKALVDEMDAARLAAEHRDIERPGVEMEVLSNKLAGDAGT